MSLNLNPDFKNNYKYITKEKLKETGEWYLYHHRNNEGIQLPCVVLTFFLMFLPGGVLALVVMPLIYIRMCNANNESLNNDPEVLRMRERWKMEHLKCSYKEWIKVKNIIGIE